MASSSCFTAFSLRYMATSHQKGMREQDACIRVACKRDFREPSQRRGAPRGPSTYVQDYGHKARVLEVKRRMAEFAHEGGTHRPSSRPPSPSSSSPSSSSASSSPLLHTEMGVRENGSCMASAASKRQQQHTMPAAAGSPWGHRWVTATQPMGPVAYCRIAPNTSYKAEAAASSKQQAATHLSST